MAKSVKRRSSKLPKWFKMFSFITARHVRLYIIIVLGISLLFVSTYVSYTLYKRHQNEILLKQQSGYSVEESLSLLNKPSISDFALIDDFRDFSPKFIPEFATQEDWLSAKAQEFWLPTDDLGLDKLEQINEQTLKDYLANEAQSIPNF
jgi:hypothetical protein